MRHPRNTNLPLKSTLSFQLPCRNLPGTPPFQTQLYRTFNTNKWIKQIPVQKYDLSKDSDALKDTRTFLQQEFRRPVHAPRKVRLAFREWTCRPHRPFLRPLCIPATVIRYMKNRGHLGTHHLALTMTMDCSILAYYLYRALYVFEPEGTTELGLVEDQIVRVVGRGGRFGSGRSWDTRRDGGYGFRRRLCFENHHKACTRTWKLSWTLQPTG